MATYYRWDKYNVTYSEGITSDEGGSYNYGVQTVDSIQVEYGYQSNAYQIKDGHFYIDDPSVYTLHPGDSYDGIGGDDEDNVCLYIPILNEDVLFVGYLSVYFEDNKNVEVSARYPASDFEIHKIKTRKGSRVGYVYSTSSSAYPNGGVQDGYYYDQRTAVESPLAPGAFSIPSPITSPTVTVSWGAANVNTDYPVATYELFYSLNPTVNPNMATYTSLGTTPELSMEVTIPAGTTSICFKVQPKDTNGQIGTYRVSDIYQVLLAPTLTVPQMVMQGQSATISWSAIEGADSYTLQRKADTDADWTQVYSGADLSYTETVGTWTSLQYRVQAVFDGTPGGWATSDPIQIVSASALVISGQDGDLGTLVNDVPYSISSDQTSPTIDVTVEVNGGEYASFQATSGQTYKVGVLDLPTGTGSIVITASTEVSNSPVTVTRTWTYSKTAQTFPAAGSVAQLTQEGAVIWPKTLDEAVRAAMNPWGGNLGTALNLLKNAALFNRTKQPKYSEVTIDLSTLTQADAQNGKIINLPVNGVMTPHRVVHIGNPDPELYDASCDGVWVLQENIVGTGAWNTSGVNILPNSTIMQTMSGYVNDYDTTVQSAIKTVKIPYCAGNGSATVNSGANGLECKIFPLSFCEVGGVNSEYPNAPADGAKLSYFLNGQAPDGTQKRLAMMDGAAHSWSLRSAGTAQADIIFQVDATGRYGRSRPDSLDGIRPAFLLPTTFTAGPYYVDNQGTIHASQEYTEAGDWLDVWGNAIPAVKIETGSYVGTGTSGSSNPNTLTFGFEPKILFVSKQDQNLNSVGFFMLACKGVTNAQCMHAAQNTAPQGPFCALNWSENSVSWYNTSGSTEQLNMNNETYFYVAIG